jgi:hypothetical protein
MSDPEQAEGTAKPLQQPETSGTLEEAQGEQEMQV